MGSSQIQTHSDRKLKTTAHTFPCCVCVSGGGSTEGGGAPGVKGGRRSELEKNLHFSSLMVEAGRRPRRWLEAAKKALRLSLLHERVPSAEKQLAKDKGQTPFSVF